MKDISDKALEAQEKMFRSQANIVGERLAIYHCCILFNAPYIVGQNATDWTEYVHAIGDLALKRYADGETDIHSVLNDIQDQRSKWISEWGRGNNRNPYTDADYQRLDEIFRNYASRLARAGGMDALQDDTLHNCSVMRLQAEKAIVKGDKESVDIATKLNKMIQDNLAAEQLRKKDVPQGEELRLDGIVDRLKNKYGLSVEMSQEQVLDMIAKWMSSRHYNMTVDAAEYMMQAIINTTRRNNDMPEVVEVPPEFKVPDELKSQFEEEQSEDEKEVFEYLGLPLPKSKTKVVD